ncbi:MAG TPA: hypothetical protein VHP99_14315 [Pyrinomonadaceae bacterium]|nr:hypothetical protein [Pyrinomonadaceae bacterium]
MQRQRILLTAALAAFVVSILTIAPSHRATALNAAAQKSGASSSTDPMATFHDYDALGGTLMLLRSDDFKVVGQATYSSSSSRGSSLSSGFVNGEWNLNLSNQSLRTIYITPNAAIDNLQPQGPPAGYYSQGVTTRTGCFDQSGNTVPLANVATTSGNCKLGVNFTSGGTDYKLLMSPFPLSGAGDPPPTCPAGGCPPTGVVQVTCNATSNGQCVNWTIEPNVTAPHANVANLYRYSSSKHSATWVFMGQYYNSFRVELTNP